MSRNIWFDMDGTLNKFYDVPNWLEKLRAYDPSPYAEAAVNLNMSLLARYLNKLKKMGYHIGILSWLARETTPKFTQEVTYEKHEWLGVHTASVGWDEIVIMEYGVPKEQWKRNPEDILFDDNSGILDSWGDGAYTPDRILEVLKALIDKG